jgi:hypothetical protein
LVAASRAARKDFLEVLDCSAQRANRPPNENEVILDKADGMDWPTFCKCDCIYAIPRDELKKHRGTVALEHRRQIVRAIIISHGWNAL